LNYDPAKMAMDQSYTLGMIAALEAVMGIASDDSQFLDEEDSDAE
jgi:hypothetical protein